MRNDLEKILYDEKMLNDAIVELGRKISEEYKGRDLVLIGILKGSVLFMADLLKAITIPCKMDFMAVSSYGSSTTSSGIVKIIKDLDFDIEGKDVLIVEDIVDTGITLQYLLKYLGAKKPSTLEVACLLDKPTGRKVDLVAKYTCFNVPDAFLVGYGLDYAEKYRNLPVIGILKKEIYS